ncbi:MAG: hypothetical protein KGD67_13230, partial [Candidatus Lokiarchaeota archaeon]|nr:hypothetical protein [Candidatus Lokiarchaeota archaeon]
IIVTFAMIIILGMIFVLSINQMEQRFTEDCEKQNFQGIKEYWDLDINCSQIENLKNIKYVNETRMGEIK